MPGLLSQGGHMTALLGLAAIVMLFWLMRKK